MIDPSTEIGAIMPNLDAVLSRLKGVKECKGYYKALCPAHQDNNPSLSVWLNEDSKVSLKCHAGCDSLDVLDALGLEIRDLYPPKTKSRPTLLNTKRKTIKTYDYCNRQGEVIHQTVRKSGKAFLQRRPDGNGGHIWSLNGIEPILYPTGCSFTPNGSG